MLKEPRKGTPTRDASTAFKATLGALGAKRSYVMALIGLALYFAVAYGPMSFVVPFMMRVHHLGVSQAGAAYGFCTAVGGLVGILLGGILTDRLAAKDVRWLCWIPAAGLLGIGGFYQAAFLVPSSTGTIAMLLCGAVLSAAAYPPMYALLHTVCGSKRRVMAVALALFVANLVGIGLGPLSVGAVSDLLGRSLRTADGLRYALVIIAAALIPAACCLWSRRLELVATWKPEAAGLRDPIGAATQIVIEGRIATMTETSQPRLPARTNRIRAAASNAGRGVVTVGDLEAGIDLGFTGRARTVSFGRT